MREIITIFAALGATEQAYTLTNRMLDDFERSGTLKSGSAWAFIWVPAMRDFRNDPRFETVAARMHFFDYWKEYGAPDDCDFNDGKVTCR